MLYYRLTFIAFLFMSFLACQPEARLENAVAANNEKLARSYFDHFNRHDWAGMTALYADNVEMLDPSFGVKPVMQTRAEIAQKYAELQQFYPDVQDQIKAVYPSGDRHIVVEFVSTATGPDGHKWELPICSVLTFDNGLITKDYTYYNNSSEGE